MKYVCHRRFKEKAICGDVNIPATTECDERNGIIYAGNKALCCIGSENAHIYFAIDEDAQGMIRGELVRSITTILRKKDEEYQNRWDKLWDDPRCLKYKRIEHPNHWLWNNQFFDAPVSDLEYILNLIQKG